MTLSRSLLPGDDALYEALLARDAAFDGQAFVCVTTTGIFCRLTCPARKPKRENTMFRASPGACLEAGFRPCRRCRPLDIARRREPLVADLLDRLDQRPHHRWSEGDLVALGFDPSTVRRAFIRHIGMTFLELARLRRAGVAMERLSDGGAVIEAQLDGGYQSASGFRDAIGRLVRDTPQSLKGRQLLKADWIETPIGAMLAIGDAERLHLLEFFDRKALPGELERLRRSGRSAISFGDAPPIASIAAELDAYFAGRSATFHTPLALNGSTFTRSVWDGLRTVPPGTTLSYGELARRLGHPAAVRAVGRANGANQIAIVIPCHRVTGADGSLTGYGGHLWRKRWLLTHERRFGPVDGQGTTGS
jgi:AraC family transcriptional regulator, regulatory protein of adaptative response / methylated-DNA-[protein]-cysteine methyltransferase